MFQKFYICIFFDGTVSFITYFTISYDSMRLSYFLKIWALHDTENNVKIHFCHEGFKMYPISLFASM